MGGFGKVRKKPEIVIGKRVNREYENIKKTISSKARQKKKEGVQPVSFEA